MRAVEGAPPGSMASAGIRRAWTRAEDAKANTMMRAATISSLRVLWMRPARSSPVTDATAKPAA